MPTNDFLPFAINTDAGVMSQADYAARAGLGVEPGLADPDFANKAWRQSSVMAAMLGRVIAGEGLNALDNGEVDALKNNFLDALAARVLLKMQAINSAGGLEYRTDHDYVPGSIVLQSGIKYICLTSNGPSSTVKSPASDTTKTYWAAVVSMADVSSTGGAGKIPIATNEGYLKAATPSSNDVSQNVATTNFINNFWNANKISGWQVYNLSEISVPNNTRTNIGSYTFTKTGMYLMHYLINFQANGNGIRTMYISNVGPTNVQSDRFGVINQNAIEGQEVNLHIFRMERIISSNPINYINALQTSGETLTCAGGIRVMRIGDK
ncbi:MAG: hypothetical protein IJ233_11725 [Pyramidobacter sp.]|nr:hypothetical protein [Pyramidobacter sp.]